MDSGLGSGPSRKGWPESVRSVQVCAARYIGVRGAPRTVRKWLKSVRVPGVVLGSGLVHSRTLKAGNQAKR